MSDFALVYDHFDPGTEGLRESLTSTGNGYFCTRGTAEWEDAAGVLPLGGAAGAEVAVARRRQRLPQALGAGVEVVIDECKVGHSSLSESEHPWSAGQSRQQLFHLCGGG